MIEGNDTLEPCTKAKIDCSELDTRIAELSIADAHTNVTKKLNYLSWSDTFMGVAKLVAMRSKDPNTQVGACIVNSENRIVSVGYNGMPNGCSDDSFPWGKGCDIDTDKHLYVCHAETNAIHNRNTASLKDCTMYVTLFPCNECAKHIIQSGISKIFYLYDKSPHKKQTIAAKRMFNSANVTFSEFVPSENGMGIFIDLSLEKYRNS